MSMKNPLTPAGIEPATFQSVAQHLNYCATPNVFRWYSLFRDGRDVVKNYERGGSPKSTRTEVNIAAAAAADLVENTVESHRE